MSPPTVEHLTITCPSTLQEVLVCPGQTGPKARAKPGESTLTINGVCYTQAELDEQIRADVEKLRKAERESERAKK
jgi:hypothetical protein